MRKEVCCALALYAPTACGGSSEPVNAAFGLDERPSNTTCVAHDRPTADTGVAVVEQWKGINFNAPIYMTQAPGDNDTWYVVERGGKIRKFKTTATSDDDTADFATITVNATGEGGLLGFAFDPAWQINHTAYASFTRSVAGGDPAAPTCPNLDHQLTSVIARMHSTTGDTLDQAPDELLKVGQPYTNHKGGNIQFGKDGMLYVGFGDGGSGDDPCGSGQNAASLLGKMLRIDVTGAGSGAYNIPTDNPFVASATTKHEIWALGMRNPWRWSFDRDTGEMWVGDVGQNTWEEIDKIEKGGNYGWNICEGKHRRGSTTELCATPGLIDAVVEHPRSEASSITGGYVYRGSAMPSLVGAYIYGDFETGNIWALTYDSNNTPTPKLIAKVSPGSLASFGQGNDGEIYTIQISSGQISKLVPTGAPITDMFPTLLSQTGCVDPQDPTKPAAGTIPYDVISPLWSDGASKERYLGIPDDATIAIGSDGDWDLPIGSVAVKNFSVAGKRVETRLFMRHADGGWAGYSYEWNDDGSDAVLLPAGKVKPVGDSGAMWTYPSRDQCLQCHSEAAGGTLGLETAQLNRDGVYPSTNRRSNQLATLDHIGMFTTALGQDPKDLPHLVDPAGSDALDLRARSYLHANCSHCHRPMGPGQGTMDLRYSQSFADTKTCNQDNTQGSIDTSTKLLVPGDPASSILSLRIHSTDSKRMPPIAVSIPDDKGDAVIDDWITSLTSCP